MLQRQPRTPVGFAHRGGRAHGPDNTLEAFKTALGMGVAGLETDAWVTSDGVAVLDHDGRARSGLRPRRISSLTRAELPDHIASLEDLYRTCGSDFELSIDVKDDDAAAAVVACATAFDPDARSRLWLCHGDWTVLGAWRKDPTFDGIRLIESTRLRSMKDGPERRAAQLTDAGVDGVNLHWTDWTGGMVALFHRFGRLTLGWDAQHERMIRELVTMGIDGVYSDHVDRLVAVLQ